MATAISISGLVKSFGPTRALDGLELEVRTGEVHGFLGPNGAGKTTTIRVLLGLLRADAGRAELLGGDPWRDAVALHRRLAYVPGDVALWPARARPTTPAPTAGPPPGRSSPPGVFVLGVNIVLAVLSALGYVAMGLPVGGSVALAVACGLTGLVFAGVAAVTAQLTEYARPANGMAFAALGVAFLLRAIGDTSNSLSWLAWLSPIGWAERFQPFAGERWAVLLLPVALLLVLLVAAVALRDRRDLGAGVLATRLGPATAPDWLRSPLALAWRLQRGALLAWAIGAAVAGLSFGVLAQDMAQFAAEDPETAKMLATLGGAGSITDIYLAAILSWIGLLAAGYAVQAILRLRSEEAELRAEPVLATTASRVGWAGSHLLVAAVGAAVVLASGGLVAGLAHGLRSGDLTGQLPRVLGAAMVQLPAVWVLAALGAALFGLLPRLVVGATWAILGVVLAVTMFGEPLQLSRWLLDLSPFVHLPRLPAATFTATPLLWLVVVAALLAAVGLAAFRRRDLVSSG